MGAKFKIGDTITLNELGIENFSRAPNMGYDYTGKILEVKIANFKPPKDTDTNVYYITDGKSGGLGIWECYVKLKCELGR